MSKQKNSIIKMNSIIIICIIVVCAMSTVAGIAIYNNSSNRLNRQLDLGHKHLVEQEYDEAILAYESAIEIEPMSEEAYLGMADAYLGKGDLYKAAEVLQKGYDIIGSKKIKRKLDEMNFKIEEEVAIAERKLLAYEQEHKYDEVDFSFAKHIYFFERPISELTMSLIIEYIYANGVIHEDRYSEFGKYYYVIWNDIEWNCYCEINETKNYIRVSPKLYSEESVYFSVSNENNGPLIWDIDFEYKAKPDLFFVDFPTDNVKALIDYIHPDLYDDIDNTDPNYLKIGYRDKWAIKKDKEYNSIWFINNIHGDIKGCEGEDYVISFNENEEITGIGIWF